MTTATATRKYNPSTGKYELPDPWANAPIKGIRAVRSDGVLVVANEASFAHILHGEWDSFANYRNLQEWLTEVRTLGWKFPDFDGMPEGVRFYHWSGTKWNPNVALPDGRCWSRMAGDLLGNKSAAEWIDWHRSHWKVVLVDEEPKPEPKAVGTHGGTPIVVHHYPAIDDTLVWGDSAKRYFLNDWTTGQSASSSGGVGTNDGYRNPNREPQEEPEFQPGDVIRDLDNGTLWYAHATGLNGSPGSARQKVRSYQQIGNRNLSAPTIVKAINWVRPERFKVISKAVGS